MASFETFSLGEALQTAEAIKGMRRQSTLDTLREQAMRGQIAQGEQASQIAKAQEERAVTQYSQEQKITNTKLVNAAAAEVAKDPSTITRWLPELKQAGVLPADFDPSSMAPEELQATAARLHTSTSAALEALTPQKPAATPQSIQEFQYAQKNPAFLDFLRKTGSSNSPSSVQEWNFYTGLDANSQKRFLELKRNPNMVVKEVGGVPTVVAPSVSGTTTTPLSTLPAEAQAAGTLEGAKAGAKTVATAKAEAQTGLSGALDDIAKMKANVQGLLDAPGFDTIYGLSGKIDPRNYVAGTDAANAEARRNQLEAESFGISIQKMKGLGALSNAEGQKVSAAYTRAVDKKQSKEAAREAWQEVQSYLDLAALRAQQRAGAQPTGQAGPEAQGPVRVNSPEEAMRLPAGTVFLTPDGRQKVR